MRINENSAPVRTSSAAPPGVGRARAARPLSQTAPTPGPARRERDSRPRSPGPASALRRPSLTWNAVIAIVTMSANPPSAAGDVASRLNTELGELLLVRDPRTPPADVPASAESARSRGRPRPSRAHSHFDDEVRHPRTDPTRQSQSTHTCRQRPKRMMGIEPTTFMAKGTGDRRQPRPSPTTCWRCTAMTSCKESKPGPACRRLLDITALPRRGLQRPPGT